MRVAGDGWGAPGLEPEDHVFYCVVAGQAS
jgi:hypothetical protein